MIKKNIRNIPKPILIKLKNLNTQYVVAACLKIYSREEILKGKLKHLGISINSEKLVVPNEPVLPPESIGKFSKRNIDGYIVVRKDLAKETHYNQIESPNWGDSYNGTHTVNLPYEMYPRDFHGPENLCIKIDAKNKDPNLNEYVLTFQLDKVFDVNDHKFHENLLKCLNILQENVGKNGVEKSGVTLDDYLQTMSISWDILPPGTQEEVLRRIFANHKSPSSKMKETATDRYNFFMELNPEKLIFGTSGLQRYFGALLKKDLVVFENVEYGNAIYIMFENWQELSKRSRLELLSGRYGHNF